MKGKIIRISPSGETSHTARSIDAGGQIAIPGMIGIHIHGAGGSDSLDGTREAFHTISRTLAELGTTSYADIVIMDRDFNVKYTIIAGKIIHQK